MCADEDEACLQKDRNHGKQWLVQWGSVTCHANDRSAAGSAGSPPDCYTLVCSRSKAAPTHCDRPTLTDWQGKHAPPLCCCTSSDWIVRRTTLTIADIKPKDKCLNTNPKHLWKPIIICRMFLLTKFWIHIVWEFLHHALHYSVQHTLDIYPLCSCY